MDPASLIELAKSSVPTLLSFSNIYFWQNQGYFDAAANTQPLLHTWSLATEWQFYAVWPVVICFLVKIPETSRLVALSALTILSLVASQAMLSVNASAAYYMMPFRIFELSLGGMLAFVFQQRLKPALEALTYVMGLALVFGAAFILDSSSPFPGLRALLPCMGAAACIYAGRAKIAAVLTTLKPITYLGLISYSVYLVHWPLLVFYKYYVFRELNTQEKLALLSLSIVMGAVLYHSVERIFMGKYSFRKPVVYGALAASVAVTAAGALSVIQTGGWVNRVDAKYLSFTKDPKNFHINNYGGTGYTLSPILGDASGERIAIMAGDSFAHQYASGFDRELKNSGKSIQAQYIHGCVLSNEYTRLLDGVPRQDCRATYSKVLELLNGNTLPFIFAEGWPAYSLLVADHTGKNAVTPGKDYFAVIEDMLSRTRNDIGDRDFILVGSQPIPPGTSPTVTCLLRPRYLPQGCEKFLEFKMEQSSAYKINQVLKKFAETHSRTFYVDTLDTFCMTGTCSTVLGGKILYSDSAHLSIDGSLLASKKILEDIRIKTGLRTTNAY
ncbi:putative lipopolysaccharide modification acyltransferase [Pseudomonas fluorescens Pf0-1]|uniref:Putative lipopolysaccharide modification acyltransferase n=2 Tax=Pseudomonas TaxID=286 RepID=Q3KD04_PSEPF|nr:putative lipopolysaccharide modification acyltransferase [Pseudomonas fluorescens Pf0-1]